jgi:hypothetical protein
VIKVGASELDSNLVQIRPHITYGDIELAIVTELIEMDKVITIFESLRFIDGVLDIENLRLFSSPGQLYSLIWNFVGPLGDKVVITNKLQTSDCKIGESIAQNGFCEKCDGYSFKIWQSGTEYSPSTCFQCPEHAACKDGFLLSAEKGF